MYFVTLNSVVMVVGTVDRLGEFGPLLPTVPTLGGQRESSTAIAVLTRGVHGGVRDAGRLAQMRNTDGPRGYCLAQNMSAARSRSKLATFET
jgi:hypothetical protein